MHFPTLAGLAVLAVNASAQAIKGFNYGSTFTTGTVKVQSDFENEFNQAKGLVGAPGFTSARICEQSALMCLPLNGLTDLC